MGQREKLFWAYQVNDDEMKSGARQRLAQSQVPMLPSVQKPGLFHTLPHTGVLTSRNVKLPLLHDSQLSATDALLAAATAASRSTGSLHPWSSNRFQMCKSESEQLLPRRRKACNRLLQRLSLSDFGSAEDLKSTRGTFGAHRVGMSPARRKERSRKDSAEEHAALFEIARTAHQICLKLTEKRPDEKSPRPGKGKASRKSYQKKKSKEKEAEMQKAMEAWSRATLASVPEADAETKSAAETRMRELEDEMKEESEDEPYTPVTSPLASRQFGEEFAGSGESSPKSGSKKRVTRTTSMRSTVAGRNDESYGLPNLQDRLDQIQNTYFGKGDLMDEATVQRMRTVFNRFRNASGNEIMQDDLPSAVEFLGYVVTSEEALEQVAKQVTSFKEMDFNEFLEFVEKYSRQQFGRYETLFHEFDEDGSGEINVSELRKLLLSIGFVVVRQMIEEALDVVDSDGNGQLNFEEFIYFLTVYQHTEGFTKDEVKRMHDVYKGFVAESVKLKMGSFLRCEDLADALVAVFGLHAEPHAVRIGHKLCNNSNGGKRNTSASDGLAFHEFLIFARSVRLAEQALYKKEFHRFDQDGSGNINASELRNVLQALGYRPMRVVIQEVLQEVDFEQDAELDFEEFFHFMLVFKQRDGFSSKELKDFKDVFRKFDRDQSDNINVHELGDMLRYLGFSVGTDNLYMLLAQVDVNRNGTLDCNEFLRLMRLHRESELKRMYDVFEHRGGFQDDEISCKQVPAALQDYMGGEVKAEVLQKVPPSGDMDFEEFVSLADQARWAKVISERRMAGFSQAEISSLEEMFSHYDKDGSGDIDSFEVQELLNDFGLKLRTRAERQEVLDQLEEARQLAAEAGVQHDARRPKSMITFWELVQLVRLVKTHRAKLKEEESQQLLQAISFSKQEIDDFRAVFLSWAKHGGMGLSSEDTALGTKVSLHETAAKKRETEDLDEEEPGLSASMLQKLLRWLNVPVTMQGKEALEGRLSLVQQTEKNELSFVGFLQVMRWMLDTNFCGINGVAQKAASAAQQQLFAKELQGA